MINRDLRLETHAHATPNHAEQHNAAPRHTPPHGAAAWGDEGLRSAPHGRSGGRAPWRTTTWTDSNDAPSSAAGAPPFAVINLHVKNFKDRTRELAAVAGEPPPERAALIACVKKAMRPSSSRRRPPPAAAGPPALCVCHGLRAVLT